MSSIQAGITKSQDGGTPPSGDRGTGKSRGATENIQPQSELKSHLEKTARFIKAFDILVRGFAWLSCVLAAWLLACLVDHWLLPLPSVLRWLVWATLVAFTVWIAVWQIVPLIIGRINPDYAAKRIERAEPRFKEGLIAWLQLSDMPDSGVPRGVMAALTYRAYRFIGGQDPSSSVDSSPLIRGLASFLILACVMALYSFVSPKSSLATAARIAMPWRTVAAPTRVQLSEVVPGSTIVSAGKPLEVSVRAVGVRTGEPVHLVFSTRDGQIVSQAIALNEPDVGSIYSGILTTTSSGIEHELQYWIEAGDAVTERFDIELAPTPSVVLERVELVYPAYTKLPKRISDGRDVEAIEGTIATIVARSNQDLVRGQLEINPTQGPDGLLMTADQILPMDVRGRELKREWQPLLSEGEPSTLVRYSVRGYNERSDSNLNPIEHSLSLVADVPPEVRLVGPKNRILRVRPTSKVQLEIRASDPDFGLNEVELSVHKAGSAVASRVILKGDGLKGKQVKRQPLDISRLSMLPGDRLELHATARDNRHDPVSGKWSPNETHADPLIVEVVEPTQPSDVPSDNPTVSPDSQPNPEAPAASGDENPRPNSGGSDSRQTQPQDPSQAGGKNGSPDQSQTGSEQSGSQENSGKQDGGEKGSEQSGVGGAGSSSEDSGEGQSSSEQSGGGGSSSSPNDASQENGSGGSQGGNSQGNNSQSGSSKEQSQGGGAGSNSQDSASSDQRNGENSTGSNQSPYGNSVQRASQNNRGGSGGSPATDAEAMKQVEQFMREKGEAPSQSGVQNRESDGKGQQASASSASQSSSKPNDADQQSSNTDSQGSRSDSSAKGAPSAESQSSTGSKQRSGENGSQNPDGQNSDGQNADGQNSGKQSGGGNNQENSSSQQNEGPSQQSGNENSSNSNSDSSPESGKGSQSGSESGSGQSGSGQSGSGQSGSGQSGNGSQDGQGGESSSGQSQDSASGKSGDGKSGQSGSSESSGQSGSQSSAGQETPGQKGTGQQAAGQQGNEQQGGNEAAGNSEKGQSSSEEGSAKSDATGQNARSGGQDAGQNPGEQPGEQNRKNPSAEQQQSGNESAANKQSGNQPSSSQESGSQSSGQQQSTQSPGGSKSATGSGNSDSGNSTNSSGRGSNNGSSNRAGGDVGEAEAADKEAAAKAADMVLDYLDRQRDQPDPELLREVNWDKNDLNKFVDRWKQARELASQGDDAAQQNWEELLTALNSSGKRTGSLGPMQRSDDFRQMSDSAVRVQPPKSLLKRWEAVQRALEKR